MNVVTDAVWSTTGNPFVDTGQEMMAAMADIDSPNELTTGDVKSLLPRLVDLYFQEGWIKNSYSIFPNSPLHNGNNRRARYTSLLDGWLRAVEEPESHSLDTTCAISGRPANVYITKVYLPMSDFGTGNFQSSNQEGTPLSAEVALALQFFPLGLVKVGKMLALPHFSNDIVQYEWAKKSVDRVEESEALGTGGGSEISVRRSPRMRSSSLLRTSFEDSEGFRTAAQPSIYSIISTRSITRMPRTCITCPLRSSGSSAPR